MDFLGNARLNLVMKAKPNNLMSGTRLRPVGYLGRWAMFGCFEEEFHIS
jgi:hypothetical protein